MKETLAALMMLPLLATVAEARTIDWQAELDRCRAMREQMQPLLLAGQGISLSRAPGRQRAAAFGLNGGR